MVTLDGELTAGLSWHSLLGDTCGTHDGTTGCPLLSNSNSLVNWIGVVGS